jgi:hypothetical protein
MSIADQNTTDSQKRSYASVAAMVRTIPNITIPAPVAIQNSFSSLKDDSSESDMDMSQLDWKTVQDSSESDDSDTIAYENMENATSVDNSVDNSANNSGVDSSSDSSEEELVVNQKHYRRVRPLWCRDGIPCFVTSVTGLLLLVYFMQFVFYMCGFVNDDSCSPAARLQYSKYHKGL